LLDGLPIHIIHHQIEASGLLEDGVASHQIRMAGVEHKLRLQAKLTPGKLIAEEGFLEGAPVAKHGILRHVDVTKAPTADVTLDQIAPANQRAGRERRRLRRQRRRGGRGYGRSRLVVHDADPFLPLPLLPTTDSPAVTLFIPPWPG